MIYFQNLEQTSNEASGVPSSTLSMTLQDLDDLEEILNGFES